jgi:GDP-L-fucose synthase
MRIMITGANGMVGKNLLEHAGMKEHEIFAPLRSELNLFEFVSVKEYVSRIKPDMIIHTAGKVGGIQANIHDPVNFLLENLDMGRNIVWAARKSGVKRLINLASTCVYPRYAPNPLCEEHILTGELEPTNEGYALAKIVVSRLCHYISNQNSDYQYKTLLPCNLYGRWDKFDPAHSHLIPAILHKLHQAVLYGQNEIEIWGDGMARREFMCSADLADCLVMAIERFESLPIVMNVGLGHDYSINEYYEIAAKVVGYRGSFAHDLSKPVGMKQKLIDKEKLLQWGWQPRISLHDGLASTYKFYCQQIDHE